MALSEKLCLSEDISDKSDQNLSVYPAETPQNKNLKNASFVEVYSPFSSSSLNETPASLDETLDLNVTFDENAKDLFGILQDLGKKNLENDETDVDSILSQVQKEEEQEDNGDHFDLSLSMAETTPFKEIIESLREEDFNDSMDTTLIPQLDGQDDGSDDENDTKIKSSQKNKSKYGALPIFVSSPAVGGRNDDESVQTALDHVKRKLSFQSTLFDSTLYEDKIECEYKAKQKENICNIKAKSGLMEPFSNCSTLDNEPIAKVQSQLNMLNELNRDSNEEKIEEFSSGEKIPANVEKLSEAKKENLEPKPALSVAELYDFQTHYKAKEGCSTKFTQDSQNSELKLSLGSSSDIFSSGEKFDDKFSHTQNSSSDVENTKISQELNDIPEDSVQNADNLFPFGFPREPDESDSKLTTPELKPQNTQEVSDNSSKLNMLEIVYETPFYSDLSDVTGAIEVGHNVLKIPWKSAANLGEFQELYDRPDVKWTHEDFKKMKLKYFGPGPCIITPVKQPPTYAEVEEWLKKQAQPQKAEIKENKVEKLIIPTSPGGADVSDMELTLTLSPCDEKISQTSTSPVLGKGSKKRKKGNNSCQITGTSLNNTYGFKATPENFQEAKTVNEFQYITVISLEIHVETRGDLNPDPAYDAVRAIFYAILKDSPEQTEFSGVIGVNLRVGEASCELLSVETEEELFCELVKLVQKWDPDIVAGYETEMLSWGYLLERSQVLGKDLLTSLSRVKDKVRSYSDEGLKVTGRILLDVWRLLRHEIALQSYTFESIVYHLLHKRVPLYSFKDLSCWYKNPVCRHRTISYYLLRVEGLLKIMDQLDMIGRTSELARLFGIQFFEVLSRGSQFRVESMMLRLAKPLNYIPVSPSVQQRAKMKAPEFLPLILEPESKLYVDPVIVLDFQSLYPSMMIAYNYCFSTCLGKVIHLGKNSPFEFGATQLKVSRGRVKRLLDKDCLNFSPCGVAFVKKKVRDGILPRMLREILETRLMVKSAMKKNKEDKVLQKVLHNRQLGLKLIANVTYGYSAANFSGRMPAVELADSVVSKGRETLQRAIEMVENTPEWGARVVYGDTDSMFVLVRGRSRSDAFEIGKKIADAVTNSNPDPVKLKLEKVYHPCILQTKKRYVGYMYESPEQKEPVYEAKGIETVRRDGCPAVAKMLEKCLHLLFETKDVSLVKQYVLRQFDKILTGRVSLQDLTFAKEYRGASGYRPGACVPALELAKKWTAYDRRSEPRRKERVPYVIVNGPPGVPLIRLVRSPREVLNDPSLRPNAIYYITKVIIPPINRCFNLIGADLMGWFNQMPRKQFQYLRNQSPVKKSTISQYFASNSCAVCGEQTQSSLCEECRQWPQKTATILNEKVRLWEQAYCDVKLICQVCTGVLEEDLCKSLDCPVLYRIHQTSRDLQQTSYVREVLSSLELNF